jgi:hypothetical protein
MVKRAGVCVFSTYRQLIPRSADERQALAWIPTAFLEAVHGYKLLFRTFILPA